MAQKQEVQKKMKSLDVQVGINLPDSIPVLSRQGQSYGLGTVYILILIVWITLRSGQCSSTIFT